MADKKNVGMIAILLGVLLLMGMIIWGVFLVKDKKCVDCFVKAVVVFLGVGAAVVLIGYGGIQAELIKAKEAAA